MTPMKWIKLSTALFEDDKFLLLERKPKGNALQLLWVKLLCLAGKLSTDGTLTVTEGVPYTPQTLAVVLRVPENLVKQGLEEFQRLGMVHLEGDSYVITNWKRHQSMGAYEKKLAYDRDYQKRRRAAAGKGQYHNVHLTQEGYAQLQQEFPQDYRQRIDRLSEYLHSTGKTYPDHLAVIRRWAGEDERKKKSKWSFLDLAKEAL